MSHYLLWIWYLQTVSRLFIYHSLGYFQRHDKLVIFFLFFLRKQDLTFHANCLHWRQFAWNVKFLFFPMETMCMKYQIPFSPMEICMKCQILFCGENQTNVSILMLLKIIPRVLSITDSQLIWGLFLAGVHWHNSTQRVCFQECLQILMVKH